MLSETEAKKRIEIGLQNALNYIKHEQDFIFDKDKIEDCLRKRSEHLGLTQKIYWLDGLSEKSFNSLHSSLDSSLHSSLCSSLCSSLGSSLRSSLHSSLGSFSDSSLHSSLCSSLYSSLDSSLYSSLHSSLGSSLYSSLRSSLHSSLGSSSDSSLHSSYNFMCWDSEYLIANNKELKEYSKFMKEAIYSGLGFIYDFDKVVIAIPMPRFQKDSQRRLHSLEKESVLWNDGFKQFYLDGIEIPENIWKKVVGKTATFKEIMEIENIEQRMVSLKYLGTDWLLRETQAKKIDQNERGDVLYQIDGLVSKPIKLAKYLDWSTDRVYIDFVLSEHTKIDEALSWKHQFSLETWLNAEHA